MKISNIIICIYHGCDKTGGVGGYFAQVGKSRIPCEIGDLDFCDFAVGVVFSD